MADLAGTENRKGLRKKTLPPTARERTPAIEVSPKSPCGAIPLERRPSSQQNPKNGPKDEETQKFACFACGTLQVQDSLTLTPDVSSSLLYHMCGFSRYLVMFDLVGHYFRSYSLNKIVINKKCNLVKPLFLDLGSM